MRARATAGPADADRQVVVRAALRVGLVAAGLVAAVVVVLAVVLGLVVVHQQESADRHLVEQTAQTATDPTAPPAGTYLTVVRDGTTRSTAGLPAGLPDLRAIVSATARGETTRERRDGLYVVTVPRDGGAVQAAYDLGPQDALRRRVVLAAVLVGVGGLVAAAGVATVVARRAVRPLVEALLLQRAFVADASHELRTPLTLLSTRVQLLRRAVDRRDHERAAADAAAVVADTARLADVVEDLLVAADPRADDVRVDTDLRTVCDEVVDSAGAYAAERSVALRVDGASVVAAVNPVAVRRAVLALVDNAVRHAGSAVSVSVAATGRTAQVVVADDGPGVPVAEREAVFRRFRSGGQGASRRRYGLGLALVRDVAVRHGGSVRVEDGARFVLTLPRVGARGSGTPGT